MKMNIVSFSAMALAITVAGCARSIENKSHLQNANQKNQRPVALDLSGKSLAEILALKYTKAELSCALWVQRNQNLDLSVSPTDSFVLDLKAGVITPQNFALSGQIQNHKIEVQIKVNSISFWGSIEHRDDLGNVFFAKYSPYANYVLTYTSSTRFENGLASSGNGSSIRRVNERLIDVALDETRDSGPTVQNGTVINRGAYRNYVQCAIDTEINPEYQDQFTVYP